MTRDPLGAEIRRRQRETAPAPSPKKEPPEDGRDAPDLDAQLAERGCEHGDCPVSDPDQLEAVETPDDHPLSFVVACDEHEDAIREELADD